MNLNNQSEQGIHPAQETDPETFDAARPHHRADEFFPQPESLGVQENKPYGGAATQGRVRNKAQFQGGAQDVSSPDVSSPDGDGQGGTVGGTDDCPAGQERWNGQCVRVCAPGYERKADGRCGLIEAVNPDCPAGQEKWNGQCVPKCAAGELRDLHDGQCKPDCNATTDLENAKPGDVVPPGYGPLIEKRASGGINFAASAAYIEHSTDYALDSGEIKITLTQAATPVNVRYFAWGVWDNWMDTAQTGRARNPVQLDVLDRIEGQQFNWHDAWKNNQILVAVIWNESGAQAFKWPSEANRATPPSVTDALFLPHNHDYVAPSGTVTNEIWNGQCVPKCAPGQHRNPITGACQHCPAGQSWNGTECIDSSGGGGYVRPPGQTACKIGINSAWLYDDDRHEPSNIFERNSLVLKPGFLADMAKLDMFRFMNLCNINNSHLAGSASVIASETDLQNRKSAGWVGGTIPGMNPELIVRIANEGGVIPWVNITHKTMLEGTHSAFLQRWATALNAATAQNVIVEVTNEAWNNGGPFSNQTVGMAQWAGANLSIGGAATGTNEWGAWGSPVHSMAGALHFLGVLNSIMRPILGNKLITVLNAQSVESITAQWPVIIAAAGYKPDMIAIATYYSGAAMSLAVARSDMPTLKARWNAARRMADQTGVLLAAYESGSEPHHNTPANRAWAISAENGLMLEELFSHIVSLADYANVYRYAYIDQFGILRQPGVSTPAWEGFLRGAGRA